MNTQSAAAWLAVHSLEGFLSRPEVGRILRRLAASRAAQPGTSFEAGADGNSVHHLNALGLDGTTAARVFSPAGRIEIALGRALPELVDLLERAFYRRIEDIQRVYPAAVWPVGWTYVEYGPGQHCTSHADGSFGGSQVGALSVRLDEGTEGGEFYVETSGSEQLWTGQGESRELIVSALYRNRWLDRVPKTRWLAQPARGTGLLWGSHLIHGTQPVRRGISKKIIAWIEGA
jgi:hypothetical protein